ALVHALVRPGFERDALDYLLHEIRHANREAATRGPRFLPGDGHAEVDAFRVMRGDLAPDAILERRDDLAARRVVLGIRGEAQQDVQWQPDGVAFDLDVAFLHDVEEAHLDLAREIGELVQRENAAIGARQHAVVDGELIRQHVPATRGANRVHVADDVSDRHVRRRQLLHVAFLARDPGDRRVVAQLGDGHAGVLGDGGEGIVVHLAAGDDGDRVIQERDQRAEYARLRLAAQPQQDEVVTCQERVDDLWHNRLVVADDAFDDGATGGKACEQVGAHLIFHRPA